jgi:hypothetical protein
MRKVAAVALAWALVLVAAGCGGGGDDEVADDPTTTAGSSSDDGTADGDGSDGTIDPGALGFLPEDCRFLLAGAFLNPLAALTPGGDVDLEAGAQQISAIADAAPAEVAGAMEVIADRFAQLAERLEGIDLSDPQAYTDPAVIATFETIEEVFDAEFEAAGEAVNAYVEQNCEG